MFSLDAMASPVALTPKLNKRNPHELHWKKKVPEWKGDIEIAYEYYYGHLDDKVLCRHCGAIPCPVDHEENKKQRIADLQFVQDLVREKKELEKQLTQMDQHIDEMVAKIARWKVDREEMAEKIRELNATTKLLSSEKTSLRNEVKRLQYINIQNQVILSDYANMQHNLKEMTQKADDLEAQIKNQEGDVRKYRQLIVKQSDEMDELTKENKKISAELEQAKMMALANQTEFDAAMAETNAMREELDGKYGEIERVRLEVKDTINDLETKVMELTEKDTKNMKLIDDLTNELKLLMETLNRSEKTVKDLRETVDRLMTEITRLQQKMANDMRFRKYVEIKREFDELKDYNHSLEEKVYFNNQNELPVLLSEGKLSTLRQSNSKPSTRRRIRSAVVLRPTNRGLDFGSAKENTVMERIDKIDIFL